jgi:hypothetical protein
VRIVPTKTHGALDYLTGAALLALPRHSDWRKCPHRHAPKLAGGGATAYSLLTGYEMASRSCCRCPSTWHWTPRAARC